MRWVSLLIQSQVSTLSHECRHLNIWFTFGWASNSSTNLSQLPHIPSRVQECSHAAFVKYDPWSNLSSQPGDCAGIPLQGSPPSLCSKKKTVAIVTSSLPALNWLSLPSVFSGFISCGQAAARQVRAALGSVGWRSVWKAWGGNSSPIRWPLLAHFTYWRMSWVRVTTVAILWQSHPSHRVTGSLLPRLGPGLWQSPTAILSDSRLATGL